MEWRRDLASKIFEIVLLRRETVAACLMPDHLHWLIGGDVDFSRVVQSFKSLTTRMAWRYDIEGKLWQRSFHDHVVRRREGVDRVARYIIENPVRAGLTRTVEGYPYSVIYANRLPLE